MRFKIWKRRGSERTREMARSSVADRAGRVSDLVRMATAYLIERVTRGVDRTQRGT